MAQYAVPDPEWGAIAETLPPLFDPDTDPAILREQWVALTQPLLAEKMKLPLHDGRQTLYLSTWSLHPIIES
ncbi:hypothetical protein BV25DRAFT_1830638 [Artomyces pyxidatus]|uniref:Uncharacterized protein n=1 Tax=Artomyces pyxidatus TaxID=48021 RepID=A0ACB8SN09_9AGAM|nr:hypothetical protein BV25DRAFT_1830638 [Artomyces pyxidatus]